MSLIIKPLSHRLRFSDIFDSEATHNYLSSRVYFSAWSTLLSCFLITEGVASFGLICRCLSGCEVFELQTPLHLQNEDDKLPFRLPCWEKSWVWSRVVSHKAGHICSEVCLSPDHWQRYLCWVYVHIGLTMVSLWNEHFTAHEAPVSLLAASLCVYYQGEV